MKQKKPKATYGYAVVDKKNNVFGIFREESDAFYCAAICGATVGRIPGIKFAYKTTNQCAKRKAEKSDRYPVLYDGKTYDQYQFKKLMRAQFKNDKKKK